MKNKNQKIQALQQDLIKYSKQIGIVDCEIPELVFYGEEYTARQREATIRHRVQDPDKRSWKGGRHTTYRGFCSYYRRLIFVNIRGTRDLRGLRHTLVHELVHYRFHYLSHTLMDDRIKKILGGKEYPRMHLECPKVPFK